VEFEPVGVVGCDLFGAHRRIGVAVYGDYFAVCRFQYFAGVSAASECAVEVRFTVFGRQNFHSFVEQHGFVSVLCGGRKIFVVI